jgi:hypothetical protein
MTARCVDNLGALAHEKIASTKNDRGGLRCSLERIVGRCEASQIVT